MKHDYLELQAIIGNIMDSPGMGGNISVKSKGQVELTGHMLIKSSGEDLKNVNHQTTIMWFDKDSTIWEEKLKPSMEYLMHLNIPSKYVVHYHPIYVLPYLCSDYTFNFGSAIDYIHPGKPLADEIKKIENLENIIFLKNHGVVIHADSIDEIKKLYYRIKFEFDEIANLNAYTPDDVVDKNNPELLLARAYIREIAKREGLRLKQLTNDEKDNLLKDSAEIYRTSIRTMI